jgi:hypothetical protein
MQRKANPIPEPEKKKTSSSNRMQIVKSKSKSIQPRPGRQHLAASLPIKLRPSSINTILADGGSQILHGKHGATSGTTTATSAAESGSRSRPQRAAADADRTRRARARNTDSGGAAGVGRVLADATVLVSVCGDVGNKLLGRERQQPFQPHVVRLHSRQREVVVGDRVRNLHTRDGVRKKNDAEGY